MELVQKKRDGHYHILQYKKFGLMKRFFHWGSWWIPKHLIYALITTILIIIVMFYLLPLISGLVLLAIFPASLAAAILWYEACILWMHRPSFVKSKF